MLKFLSTKLIKILISSTIIAGVITTAVTVPVVLIQNHQSVNSKIVLDLGGPVQNDKFKANQIFNRNLFAAYTDSTHSFRIPGIIKTNDNKILVNADQRFINSKDLRNVIDQVFKSSDDNGFSWSDVKPIVKIASPKTNKGLIIDGTFAKASRVVNGFKQNKILFYFNMFTEQAGIVDLSDGNPYLYLNNIPYLKLWIKKSANRWSTQYENPTSLLKPISNKPNWYRQYKLPENKTFNTLTSTDKLVPANNYVDNLYDPINYTITGRVYENVKEEDFKI